jgi:hypothetical protein
MKRHIAFAFVAMLVVPCAARAQLLEPERPLRLTVSPLIGYAFSTKVSGFVLIGVNGQVQSGAFETHTGAGPVTGVAADYLLRGRLGVMGSLTYTSRGNYASTTALNGDLIPGSTPGGSMITLKGGGRFELVEPESDLQIYHPRAYVHAGGALMRESFPSSIGGGSTIHPGLNAGVEAEITTPSRRVSLRFGFEGTYVFWRDNGVSRSFGTEFTSEFGSPAIAAATADNAHVFEISAALALHF